MWLFRERDMVAVNTDKCAAISYNSDNQVIKFELGVDECVEWTQCSLQVYTQVLKEVGCHEVG